MMVGLFVNGVAWILLLLANGYKLTIAVRRQVNVVAQDYRTR